MILVRNIRMELSDPPEKLAQKAARRLGIREEEIRWAKLKKRSLDARRKKDLHYICSAVLSLKQGEERLIREKKAQEYKEVPYLIPKVTSEERPVIVGLGPAGLFAALALSRAGLRPIVIEQGADAETRARKREEFQNGGALDPDCNVQFGEGGAGTFSDGKLHTGIHDPRLEFVLEELVRHGAQENIQYDSKPHIGTDVLIRVVTSMRQEIIAYGGEVRLHTKMTDLQISDGVLTGIRISRDGQEEELPCRHLILAIGHSSRDTFEALNRKGVPMEPKAFSMGVRIEHRQETVNEAQYGPQTTPLPAADYSLNVHLPDGTSAYTFCMCPGGYVVAAASEEGGVVTNGMSYSGRSGENANAALLVTLHPEDFPDPSVLGGMYWQRHIEQTAFQKGGGNYQAPAQTVGDFLAGQASEGPGTVQPTYRPGVCWTDLHTVLPERITGVLEQAIPELGRKMRGFDDPDAVLTAPETRSSSPVRILRGEDRNSLGVRGLYPCGEGAGYAGGISSAAVDGLRCAESLLQDILEKQKHNI